MSIPSPEPTAAAPTPPWRRARLWVLVAAGLALLGAGWFVLHLLTAGPPALADLERKAGCVSVHEVAETDSETRLGSCTVDGAPVLFGTFGSNEDRDGWVYQLRGIGSLSTTSMCVAHGDRWAVVPLRKSSCAAVGRNLGVEMTTID